MHPQLNWISQLVALPKVNLSVLLADYLRLQLNWIERVASDDEVGGSSPFRRTACLCYFSKVKYLRFVFAGVAESVYAHDLRSCPFWDVGSSPTLGTIRVQLSWEAKLGQLIYGVQLSWQSARFGSVRSPVRVRAPRLDLIFHYRITRFNLSEYCFDNKKAIPRSIFPFVSEENT